MPCAAFASNLKLTQWGIHPSYDRLNHLMLLGQGESCRDYRLAGEGRLDQEQFNLQQFPSERVSVCHAKRPPSCKRTRYIPGMYAFDRMLCHACEVNVSATF